MSCRDPIADRRGRADRRYRSDPALRELHRLHPTVHIWDDHEVENNYTDNRPAPAALQRAAGYRAAFEWLPRASFRKERFRLYRRIALGRAVDLFLLDLRQYRAVDAGDQPIRLLGDRQRDWLIRSLRASRARWKVIANPVTIAPVDYGNGVHTAEEFVATGSLLFAVVAKDGAIGANRGVPQNGRATVAGASGNTTFTVPFSDDVSACAATASPTDPDAPQLAVAPGADKKSIVITEKGMAPFGFHLQVTC